MLGYLKAGYYRVRRRMVAKSERYNEMCRWSRGSVTKATVELRWMRTRGFMRLVWTPIWHIDGHYKLVMVLAVIFFMTLKVAEDFVSVVFYDYKCM